MNKVLIFALLALVASANYAILNDVCCTDGNYLDSNGACQPCYSWCESCLYSNYAHSNDAQSMCESVMSNCYSQTEADICATCDSGYYKDSDACVSCSSGCADCTSADACTTCNITLHNAGDGTCVALIANCTSMTANTSNCSDCNSMYYVSDNACSACGVNCLECSSSACSQCTPDTATTYYSPESDGCNICSANCVVCSNNSTCTTCAAGYAVLSSACTACTGDNVATCTYTNDAQTISTCIPLYYENTTNSACESCGVAATGCTASVAGAATSVTCPDTGYHATGSVCTPCPASCPTCNTTGCLSCDGTNMKLTGSDPNIICESCGSNVMTCNMTSGDISACNSGYGSTWATDVYANCSMACEVGCNVCRFTTVNTSTTPDDCTTCMTDAGNRGYFAGTDGTCVICTDTHCTTCNVAAATCTACMAGYYTSSNACAACISQCASCTQNNQCTTCNSGYVGIGTECHLSKLESDCGNGEWYNSASTALICEDCISKCDVCTAGSGCTTCRDEYGYVGATCQSCTNADANLMRCDGNVAEVSTCMAGFVPSSDSLTCVGCIDNCGSCMSDAALCDDNMCMDGYTQNETRNSCLQCATGCKACSSTCIKGCETCWDLGTNTADDCACADGYERDADTHMCKQIIEPDMIGEGEDDAQDTGSTSGSVLKFALMVFVLCLSYLI